ncbi:hypothetical protein [Dialister micraerophilus]|uniref:hypothetical protein n=1 Tax=Dialister micraerophilus TaxID=309120 RepID=UPI0023F118BB|nr:hypothetical protein [Dialister micraerophilus]
MSNEEHLIKAMKKDTEDKRNALIHILFPPLIYHKEVNTSNEEHLIKAMKKDAEDKRNALIHLTKVFSYTDYGVIDMEYDQEKEVVIVTFLSGEKQTINVKFDNTIAMIYDIFRQIEWLR